MNWSKVWFAISLVGVASLIFALGFATGNRVWFGMQSPLELNVKQWNGAQVTDLALIKTVPLLGRASDNDIKTIGRLLFVPREKETIVLFDIDQMMMTFNTQEKSFPIPAQLRIYAVQKNPSGNTYDANQTGVISLEPSDRVFKGRFSSVISLPASRIERFLLLSPTGASDLPVSSALTFLPSDEQKKNAPYAWSESLATAVK